MEALFAHPCGLWKSNTQEVWTGDIAREPRDLLGGEGLQFWCLLFWGSVFLWQGSSPDRDKRSRENPRKLWKEIYPKDESIWTKDWYLTHFLVGVGDLSQSVQSFSHVRLLVTPRIATWQASLSITNSRVYSNSCPLSQWCHPTISSSEVPFTSCLQSFPASGSFQMSQFFASGGQSIGVSASASVLPMNIQDWSL